jgi:deoxyribonuclease V
MKLAIDTYYMEEEAITAGIGFERWESDVECGRFLTKNRITSDYIPGEFYKRELPGILSLLNNVPWTPEIIIIDGYVTLGEGRIGLGGHLFKAFDGRVPIIGVAKKPYAGNSTALPLLRGTSRKPLFITAMGIEVADAKVYVASMAGQNRIPTILKAVDALARDQATFVV